MKNLTLITSLVALATALNAATLELNFEDVGKFSDFTLQGLNEKKTKNVFVKDAERSLKLKKYIGEDRTLAITFTDIDMAGDVQPWRNKNNADIRYVDGVYPPSMKFSYSLTDENGETVVEGEESIKDLNFNFSIKPTGNSHFKYEMQMLEDWARTTLPSAE